MTVGGLFIPPSDLDPVTRALTYPYPAPPHDFLFRQGRAEPVERLQAGDRAGRIPVLAIGSNRAPAQLARKFADMAHAEIAVERVRIEDLDVVYSAHLSGYAAVAATLLRVPGTRVEISITWLGPELMARMHATEGIGTSYDYVELHDLAGTILGGGRFDRAFAYVCRLGALTIDGAPLAVDAIRAERRSLRAIDQPGVQRAMIRKLGLDLDVARFIRGNAGSVETRLAREARASVDALPFDWPALRAVAVG